MVAVQGRGAVVVPGFGYGSQAPLLMYAGEAADARGARLQHISWVDLDKLANQSDPMARGQWVVDQVAPVLDQVAVWSVPVPLLIGKSLGTHAASLAAERGLPGVWLTPLLHSSWVSSALRRATAPCLLVGGSADPSWDAALARELSPHVLEVDGADHGMFVPGRLARSAEVLGRVATALEDFLDEVVWP